jgi:putative DNA primase/helicase
VIEGATVRAIALVNGRARCKLTLFRINAPDTPLLKDDVNVGAERERLGVVGRLPVDLRDEFADVLLKLSVEIDAELLKAPQSGRSRARKEGRIVGAIPPTEIGEHGPTTTSGAVTVSPAAEDMVLPPEYSDDALAVAFTERYTDTLRYTAKWNRWHLWDGTRWKDDETLHVFDLARPVLREHAERAKADSVKLASMITSAKTVNAITNLARSDRAFASTVEQWDADDWILNTPDGVIELRTGDVRSPRRDEYGTKITAVGLGERCPLWKQFLTWATGEDEALQKFLQRMCGYSLTGLTNEHALFFSYGTGGNGKGTFHNTINGILGDYAKVAPIEAFTASHSDRHPTELAMLRGSRLVTAQETEQGRRWAESKIKALTGGDPISARFMRADFFTYQPKFKLVIAGNYKPAIRSVDEALRRRLHLIPWNQRITADKKDKDLPEKLRAEWPAILNWMVAGCLMWIDEGLAPPDCVEQATTVYFEEEDSLLAWVSECCDLGEKKTELFSALYQSWEEWAKRHGEDAGTSKSFSQALTSHGFEKFKSGNAKMVAFKGLWIRPIEDKTKARNGDE